MDNRFSYTYSASRHAEVEAIRQKYTAVPSPDDKLLQLRRLDKSCELPAKIISIAVGIAGTAVFITAVILLFHAHLYAPGAVLGIIGLGIMAAAVPIFNQIVQLRRRALAPEIQRLCDEIEKQSN